jgi:magnesium-transporting ATPase (P-type)
MIQRIQTLYLILIALLNSLGIFFYQPLDESVIIGIFTLPDEVIWGTFSVSATLALVSVFQYKQRSKQLVINRINLLLELFLMGFFAYLSLNLSGEDTSSLKGIAVFVPLFSIVLLVMANKSIQKDEDLVKSVDRLR